MGVELRLGTRKSPLALAQSGAIAAALEAAHPGLSVRLVPIDTAGDRTAGDLAAVGGKGLFTQELEAGLLSGALDLAVHSLKDLPVALPPGLIIAAYPRRADPSDALVSATVTTLAALPAGGRVLTGSLRRRAQLLYRRPDLQVETLRGNVQTRLRRWRESGADAVVLATAGLERLNLLDLVPAHALDPQTFLPAPGQGILALETPEGSAAEILCRALTDPETARAATAEREVVRAFGGDCTLPLAAWARTTADGHFVLTAQLTLPDGSRVAHAEVEGEDPRVVATACIARLQAAGAGEILDAIRSS